MKVWQRLEPLLPLPPLSPLLMKAFAGAAIQMGCVQGGAAFVIGFDCMLRSGQLYNLSVKDITFMRDGAVLWLGKSKSGKHSGANEMVVVESAFAVQWLQTACSLCTGQQNCCFVVTGYSANCSMSWFICLSRKVGSPYVACVAGGQPGTACIMGPWKRLCCEADGRPHPQPHARR